MSSSVIDLEALLAPILGDSPAGVALRASAPEFAEIQRLLPQPDRATVETDEPPAPPDWAAVRVLASDCLQNKSKDLRMAFRLAQALVHLEGFAGLRDSLKLFTGLLQRYWDGLSPSWDREWEEPEAQVSILEAFCRQEGAATWVRNVPLRCQHVENFEERIGPITHALWQKVNRRDSDDEESWSWMYYWSIEQLYEHHLADSHAELLECKQELREFISIGDERFGRRCGPYPEYLREAIEEVDDWIVAIAQYRGFRLAAAGADSDSDGVPLSKPELERAIEDARPAR